MVYPNPTRDLIYFKVQNLDFKNLGYSVINNTGIEIIKGNVVNPTTYFSLSQFPASNYYIKIYRASTEILTYEIIKIK